MEVKTIQGRWCLKVYWVGVCSHLATKRREMVGWSDGWLFGRLGCWMVGQLNNWMQGGWQRGLEPSLYDRPPYRPPSPAVKKFGRVRLSTIFLQNKYGGECRHGGTMSFCSVLSFPASKHQEKVFKNIFNGIFGHQEAWCMNSSWVTTLSVIRHLGKFSYL